jgi:predicted anti-sigma-YlaC factor YlaD
MDVISLMCERARRWSSLRVDGELSELESALLDAHLGGCHSCRAFAQGTESVAAALSVARLEEPAPFALKVPRRRRARRVFRSAAVATLVLVAAIVAGIAGLGAHGGSARAVKPVAMVSTLDTPNELRQLRRAGLIQQGRVAPRNRRLPVESF